MVIKKNSEKISKKQKDIFTQLKADLISIKEEVRNDVVGPVVASFGFIIALVWRDAIKSALDVYLASHGLTGQAYLYNFISAILVTIFVIAIMVTITKLSREKKKQKVEEQIQRVEEKALEDKK